MCACCSLAKGRAPVWQSCQIHNQMHWKTAAVKGSKLPPASEAPFLAVSRQLSILPGEMGFTFQPRISGLRVFRQSCASPALCSPFLLPLPSQTFLLLERPICCRECKQKLTAEVGDVLHRGFDVPFISFNYGKPPPKTS